VTHLIGGVVFVLSGLLEITRDRQVPN